MVLAVLIELYQGHSGMTAKASQLRRTFSNNTLVLVL